LLEGLENMFLKTTVARQKFYFLKGLYYYARKKTCDKSLAIAMHFTGSGPFTEAEFLDEIKTKVPKFSPCYS
jgi:hypothetical protein